jgi:adenylate cyclase
MRPFIHLRQALFLQLFFGMLTGMLHAAPQSSRTPSAWLDSVMRVHTNNADHIAPAALPVLDSALTLLRQQHDTCRMALVQSWRGHCFEQLGQLDTAVAAVRHGMGWFTPYCDSLVLMSLRMNLAKALLSLGEVKEVERLCTEALDEWNPTWPYHMARNGLLTNRAIAIAKGGDLPGALLAFKEVLRTARTEGRLDHEVDALDHIGAVFSMLSQKGRAPAYLDSARAYAIKVLQIHRTQGDRQGMMLQYSNLATMAHDRRHFRRALAYLDSTAALADQLKVLEQRIEVADGRRSSYQALGRMDSAYKYLAIHAALKDSLLDQERTKAIAAMQEKYDREKKAREITELKVVQVVGELQQARLRRTRNIYLYSGLVVVMVAGGLWSRLRYVHRSRAAIQQEKEISDGLLHNILPEEVADELRAKGFAETREFAQATILFTDFKGFTQLSERLTAAELVAEIDHCFKAFDAIMEKYRIEKIKTIGDAYMAAGGLPDPAHGSPVDVVRAALEMQAFMAAYKAQREAAGQLFFQMRVGIHTGPVIAGIVGLKKFAYDIWGDTVNTASRMESHGQVGQVNISESTYALIKDALAPLNVGPAFTFTPRGKVKVKGKGEMAMYFVTPS